MRWWGKVIGGAAGWAIAGPIGAVLGLALGAVADGATNDQPEQGVPELDIDIRLIDDDFGRFVQRPRRAPADVHGRDAARARDPELVRGVPAHDPAQEREREEGREVQNAKVRVPRAVLSRTLLPELKRYPTGPTVVSASTGFSGLGAP